VPVLEKVLASEKSFKYALPRNYVLP